MQRSGTGNRELSSMMVPPKSSVVWRFDCQNAPKQRGTFVLSSKEQGQMAVKLTDQTGLGGGGQKPFTQSGRYSFGVNTPCGWDLTVESTPLPALHRGYKARRQIQELIIQRRWSPRRRCLSLMPPLAFLMPLGPQSWHYVPCSKSTPPATPTGPPLRP